MTDIDFEVSAGVVAACALWFAAVALVVTGCLLHVQGVGDLGLVVAAGAATVTIRGYFVKHGRIMRNTLGLAHEAARVEALHSRR